MPTHRPNAALVACGLAAALALAGAAAPGAADDAAKAFTDRFGARVAQAAATKEADDDLALSADLLAAAKAPNVAPGLLALLCEKAFALAAAETRGAPTAIEAMTLLAARAPDKRAACQDRIIDVYQGEYAKARGIEKVKAGETLVRQIIRFADARVEETD
ncbi:MAG: hypothetical protein IMZ66_04930 [Planctomycetes bacterium]|nr:hypothetical protein [Planctomycetota bacterium]